MRTTSALLGRQPTRRRNMERQQFLHGPPVISDGGGHGWGAGSRGSSPRARQARMIGAEVVDRADQVPPIAERGGAPGQGTAPTGEGSQAFAEGGVEPFNVGGVDYPVPLRAAANLFDLRGGAGQDSALGADHTPLNIGLDDLSNIEEFPRPQVGPAGFTRGERSAKGFPDRAGVGPKPLRAEQQRGTGGTPTDPRQQAPDQP